MSVSNSDDAEKGEGMRRVHADITVDEDARPMAGKYLAKWRPGFIEKQTALLEGKQE